MKKYAIICLICCVCVAAVFVYMLHRENSVASLRDSKIQSICKEIALNEAKNDQSMSLRRQRDIEKICFCVAKAMPGSVTEKEFKALVESNDRSRATDIVNDCIDELILQGVISEEDV